MGRTYPCSSAINNIVTWDLDLDVDIDIDLGFDLDLGPTLHLRDLAKLLLPRQHREC